ncbi:hypothetical protein ELI_4331 [Eubacterium callanderi]|uniref:Uncharacterized protein n=1 Tax=Eubacterium callanderi TaxID=53442 RepID=E3GQH9_9FIRM|nr:hypothetical protein ELI_4331 [Eubacterium callanderi]
MKSLYRFKDTGFFKSGRNNIEKIDIFYNFGYLLKGVML